MRPAVFALVLVLAGAAGWFLLPQREPRLGAPIVTEGRSVGEEELQRWLIYGPCRSRLEAHKTWFLIETQRERLALRIATQDVEQRERDTPFRGAEAREQALAAARAAARERLVETGRVSAEELELEYARAVEDFLHHNPTLDLEAEIGRTYRRSDWFREELRLGLAFDKLFFPAAPMEWPEETWEALEFQALEQRDARDLSRKSARESIEGHDWIELRRDSPDALASMRDAVRRRLLRRARFETTIDGLAPGFVLVARGEDEGCSDRIVRTAELWAEIEDAVEPWEIEAARSWLGTVLAVRAALEEEGAIDFDAERERVLSDLRQRAERSGKSLDDLAHEAGRFPSPEAWLEYQALREVFRASTATKAPAVLPASIERSNWIHGGGRVHVEILLASAADIAHHRWLPDGMARAHEKAQALKDQLDANANAWSRRRTSGSREEAIDPFALWNRLLDEQSDWWDPPDPREGENPRPPRHHGRFYGRTWSELRMLLSESEATDWAQGTDVCERVFFEQEPGTIAGPFPCALGWVLVRLGARRAPETQIDFANPEGRERVIEDELHARFAAFARDARARAGFRARAR